MDIYLFSSKNKKEYVAEFIENLDSKLKKKIVKDFELIEEYGYRALKRLNTRKMEGNRDFWEIKIERNKIAIRLFYIVHENNLWIIHGFIKKTQKTPRKEIDIAEERIRDLYRRSLI